MIVDLFTCSNIYDFEMLKGSKTGTKRMEEDYKHFFTVQVIVCATLILKGTPFYHREATEK